MNRMQNQPNEDESHSEATWIQNERIQNKKRTSNKYSTKHNIQRKRQRIFVYRKNSFDDFWLMIVDPPPILDSDESDFISSCYVPSMENQSNEVIYEMVLTHLLKRWYENKTQSHPSSIAMTLAEHISLKVCCIILK